MRRPRATPSGWKFPWIANSKGPLSAIARALPVACHSARNAGTARPRRTDLRLDPVVTDELLRLLIEDFANEGRTIFLSSHHLSEVEHIAEVDRHPRRRQAPPRGAARAIRADIGAFSPPVPMSPTARNAQILSAIADGASCDYIVTHHAEEFAAELRAHGATVLNLTPLNLGWKCSSKWFARRMSISGNAGAIRV